MHPYLSALIGGVLVGPALWVLVVSMIVGWWLASRLPAAKA